MYYQPSDSLQPRSLSAVSMTDYSSGIGPNRTELQRPRECRPPCWVNVRATNIAASLTTRSGGHRVGFSPQGGESQPPPKRLGLAKALTFTCDGFLRFIAGCASLPEPTESLVPRIHKDGPALGRLSITTAKDIGHATSAQGRITAGSQFMGIVQATLTWYGWLVSSLAGRK